MRIPRIYQAVPLASNCEIALDAIASQHLLKVLRLREGAEVIVFDGQGQSFRAALTQSHGKTAVVTLSEQLNEHTESPLRVHVGLGISKGERMDYAIQKLVETGVYAITPLQSDYTVVKLDEKREHTRLQHWQGVIVNACEQCGRNHLPQLNNVCTINSWIDNAGGDCRLVFDATGNTELKSIQPVPKTVSVLIGPEGGLSEQEIRYASHQGFQHVRLGPRILRTETAAVAIGAALQTLWGDY